MSSAPFPARLFAISAAILLVCTGCTYVGQGRYEEKLQSLDEDGDGCTKGAVTKAEKAAGIETGDCNDNNEFECGLHEEVPYDGWDNNCDSDGYDLVDEDGDGYPGISRQDWEKQWAETYPELSPDMRAQWPPDVHEDEVDCRDSVDEHPDAANINPGEIDRWYDGIDTDCGGNNDFDSDEDGYMEDADKVLDEHPDKLTVREAYTLYRKEWDYDFLPDPNDDSLYGDCNDDVFFENPGFTLAEDDWYDGVDTNCDGLNDFDRDQDGFMPPMDALLNGGTITFGDAYDNFIGRYYSDQDPPWGEAKWDDCLDKADSALPGIDPGTVYPCEDVDNCGASPDDPTDIPYDGVNQDCDNARNDFDVDEDGYRDINTNEADYTAYTSAGWPALFTNQPPTTQLGDCDDTDPNVFPGALEMLGDAVDQDCDNGVDTTVFGFGDLLWDGPRRPIVGKSSTHYVLTTTTDRLDLGSTVAEDRGVTLLFDTTDDDNGDGTLTRDEVPGYDQPYEGTVIFWQGASSQYPLGLGVDMVTDEIGGLIYPTASYYRSDNGGFTYLIVRQLKWDSGTNFYAQSLAYHGLNRNDPYQDLDLVRDLNDYYWVFACGVSTLHFFTASAATGLWQKKEEAALLDSGGGSVCFLEVPDPAGVGLGTVCGSGGCTSYDLDPTLGLPAITASTSQPWGSDAFTYADTHGDWLIATDPTAGVLLYNLADSGVTQYEKLTSDQVFAADMVMHGGDMYLVAVVDDGSGGAEVQLHYGDPNATMSMATVDFAEAGVRDLTPQGVSIYVDSDRVFLAASGPEASNTPDQAAVGWMFLGTP